MRSISLLIAAAALVSACKRPEDEAAKQRIFSPEQPTGVDAKAREAIDSRRLAEDPALAERVLRMSRGEIATRLGAHKLASKTGFKWSMGEAAPDAGPNEVALAEEGTLVQAANGDFQAEVHNDRNQGFEAVWTGGEIYVRSRFGPFRKRRTDRTDPPRLREQTSSNLGTFDQLARGLKLSLKGETAYEGRRAYRYEIAGSGNAPAQGAGSDLPPVQWPQNGPDADTQKRMSLWRDEQPVEVSGHVVVDAESAAPLAAELHGRFRVAQSAGPAAELSVDATEKTTSIGKALAVKTPTFEAEPSVPHAVKDPLRFLGKEAPAAGSAAQDEDEEEAPAETTPPPPAKPK